MSSFKAMGRAVPCFAILYFAASAWASANEPAQDIEVASVRAHFAQEFCGTSSARIAKFKQKLKSSYPNIKDFEEHWQFGWHREDDRMINFRSMRETNPTEYAERVKRDCARIKWQAENSVRVRKRQ